MQIYRPPVRNRSRGLAVRSTESKLPERAFARRESAARHRGRCVECSNTIRPRMIPNLSPAALSLGLGAGQPGFGQRPSDDEEEILRKKKLLASANSLTGQPL